MCYDLVVKQIDIAEAKAHFSRLLRDVRAGESVVICDRSVPIAELRPIAPIEKKQRTLGPDTPGFELPESFWDPLPLDMVRSFEGHDA